MCTYCHYNNFQNLHMNPKTVLVPRFLIFQPEAASHSMMPSYQATKTSHQGVPCVCLWGFPWLF